MFKAGFQVLWALISWLKYPIFALVCVVGLFYLLCFINIMIELIKGRRFKKGTHNRVKRHGFFRRILIDLPKQFVSDTFDRDPEFFKYQGLIIFEGRQGSGKTTSMVYEAMRMQEEYPLAKCTSNLGYTHEDVALKDWRMLLKFKNGIQGIIVLMDELQNWFSSNDSRNFPPEMLTTITQNRKNRRIIMGTAQNFYLLAKPIRTQTTEVRRCATFLGCLTVVRRFEPILDAQGDVAEWKKRGMYFFVHDKKLRDSYDTFKTIERLANVGFQDNQSQAEVINNTYVSITENKKRK